MRIFLWGDSWNKTVHGIYGILRTLFLWEFNCSITDDIKGHWTTKFKQ